MRTGSLYPLHRHRPGTLRHIDAPAAITFREAESAPDRFRFIRFLPTALGGGLTMSCSQHCRAAQAASVHPFCTTFALLPTLSADERRSTQAKPRENALRCDGLRSALHSPMQCTALPNAVHCIFRGKQHHSSPHLRARNSAKCMSVPHGRSTILPPYIIRTREASHTRRPISVQRRLLRHNVVCLR